MEDLTARIIAALRKAAQNARNADEAVEPTALADALEGEGAPIPPPAPEPEPAAEPPAAPAPVKKARGS